MEGLKSAVNRLYLLLQPELGRTGVLAKEIQGLENARYRPRPQAGMS
jgi:hypothetical protein